MVTLLMPASHILEVRAPHLSFIMLKEYWFRELYLGLKVTASFDRAESYTRVIDGQVRCITPEVKPQNLQVIWNVQFITVFVPAWMIPPTLYACCLSKRSCHFLFVARVGLFCWFCDLWKSFSFVFLLSGACGPKTVPFLGPCLGIFWSLLYQGCRSATFWFQCSFVAYGGRKGNCSNSICLLLK